MSLIIPHRQREPLYHISWKEISSAGFQSMLIHIYLSVMRQLFLQRLQSFLLMKQGQASIQCRAVRMNLGMRWKTFSVAWKTHFRKDPTSSGTQKKNKITNNVGFILANSQPAVDHNSSTVGGSVKDWKYQIVLQNQSKIKMLKNIFQVLTILDLVEPSRDSFF